MAAEQLKAQTSVMNDRNEVHVVTRSKRRNLGANADGVDAHMHLENVQHMAQCAKIVE